MSFLRDSCRRLSTLTLLALVAAPILAPAAEPVTSLKKSGARITYHRQTGMVNFIGADLAVPANDRQGKRRLRIGPKYVVRLEHLCDEVNAGLQHLNSFVLPGGTRGAAQLHVCRTVCRRAERHALRVADANPEAIRYLNRLSDLLFILGRGANDGQDRLWQPGERRAVTGAG